jgi:hypothetical protein
MLPPLVIPNKEEISTKGKIRSIVSINRIAA